MPSPILANPAAYLRAINAPPIMGPYSAMTSTPYLSGGIGVGPGNQMVMKDQAGIDAAARAWAAAMAQQQAAGPNYAGMVFGDSPGQASQMAIGLRNQRAAEAAAAAQRAQAAQQFAIQQEALRQANLLNAQIRMAQVQENAAVRRDATEQRREASREQLLARLLGGSGSGSGSGTAGSGIDVTSILRDKEALRTAGANLEAQQQALYNQQFLAARQAAEQFPGYTVSKGTARNPAPSIDYVGDPSKQSDEALRVIQTAMLGQTTPKPVEAWTDWDWSRFYGSGETPMTGPGFLDQLQNLQAQQAAAKANLATMSDVFAARKDLAGPKQGPNPQVLQALLQYLNPAPAQVPPSRIVPPPLTLLDNRTAPVVNRARAPLTEAQAAWYAQHAPFSPNAPGQAPAPVPGFFPGGANPLADAALGLFPGGVAPTPVPGPLSAPAAVPTPVGPVTHEFKNGRVTPVSSAGAPPVEPELSQYAFGLAEGSIQSLLGRKDAARNQELRSSLDADLASWTGTTPGYAAVHREGLVKSLGDSAVRDTFKKAYSELDRTPELRDFKALDRALAGVYKVDAATVAESRDMYLSKFRDDMGPEELQYLLQRHVPRYVDVSRGFTPSTRTALERMKSRVQQVRSAEGMLPSDQKLFMEAFQRARSSLPGSTNRVESLLRDAAAIHGMLPSDQKLFMEAFQKSRK